MSAHMYHSTMFHVPVAARYGGQAGNARHVSVTREDAKVARKRRCRSARKRLPAVWPCALRLS